VSFNNDFIRYFISIRVRIEYNLFRVLNGCMQVFEKIKGAFSSFIKAVAEKDITENELENYIWDLEIALISSDVAAPVAQRITQELKETLIGKRIRRFTDMKSFLMNRLMEYIKSIFPNNKIDLIKLALERRKVNLNTVREGGSWRPFIVLFLGPNGSGKTTTIAKLAWKMKKEKLIPLLVAADTFRAGAIEQLEKHGRAIGVPIIKRRYGDDPASVAYDAISHAIAKRRDAVLIDTAGRLGSDIDLLNEMAKIARISKPDLKVLVIDALSGNDIANQAEMFANHVGVDCNILTKVDADVKGGAALTLVYTTKAPICYLGIGQNYDDLMEFDLNWFLDKIFS